MNSAGGVGGGGGAGGSSGGGGGSTFIPVPQYLLWTTSSFGTAATTTANASTSAMPSSVDAWTSAIPNTSAIDTQTYAPDLGSSAVLAAHTIPAAMNPSWNPSLDNTLHNPGSILQQRADASTDADDLLQTGAETISNLQKQVSSNATSTNQSQIASDSFRHVYDAARMHMAEMTMREIADADAAWPSRPSPFANDANTPFEDAVPSTSNYGRLLPVEQIDGSDDDSWTKVAAPSSSTSSSKVSSYLSSPALSREPSLALPAPPTPTDPDLAVERAALIAPETVAATHPLINPAWRERAKAFYQEQVQKQAQRDAQRQAQRQANAVPRPASTAPDPRTTLLQAAATPLPPDDDEEIEVQHGEGAPLSRKLRKVIKSPLSENGAGPSTDATMGYYNPVAHRGTWWMENEMRRP